MNIRDFYVGKVFDAYDYFGAHPDKNGVWFRVYAPSAEKISLIGEFNQWEGQWMEHCENHGVYQLYVPDAKPGMLYKYKIYGGGRVTDHCDPYGFGMELRPNSASVVVDLSEYKFHDRVWMDRRQKTYEQPMNIYEMHAGSWHTNPEDPNGWYNYAELAEPLIAYLKENHYNYVEFLPLSEHPADVSWGYQTTGYFSPTSRYGTAAQLKELIDKCHQADIGVILDFVPVHFAMDDYGLAMFDGTPLYEYADPRKGEHPDWGTKVFDYGKNEVKDFLISNAVYWVEKFHVDGLRVDAVASMLYLDYGRQNGQWVPNRYGGNQNLEAIEFFKHLNTVLRGRNSGAMMIAEESTAWPNVTKHPQQDGLGFTFKWNMGWMHDFLEYMKLDPYFRKYNHHRMTFGLTYFTSENYILVLSHDEVVHLKCSMINKMPGLGKDKFSNLKAGYTFMLGHPGKKLLFMGQDFGQWHEWDEKVALDWYLTKEEDHQDLQMYVRDLLHLYRRYPALFRLDNDWNGFQWVNANDGDRSIFSFIRKDETSKKNLLFVINFTPVARPDYRVGVPRRGNYTLLLDQTHGAYKLKEAPVFKASKGECDGQPYSIAYPLAPYGTGIFRF